VPHFVEENFAA
jgi:hypothetical protein